MELGPQQFGKWLVTVGVVIVAVGLLLMLPGRFGLFRLPGDLEFGGKNWRIYFPVATCVLLSLILTLLLWLIRYLRR